MRAPITGLLRIYCLSSFVCNSRFHFAHWALWEAMRKIKCTYLGCEAQGLPNPPFEGPLGQEIFENVSAEAWSEWLEMQTKIINEYRLDLSEGDSRKTLLSQMRTFLKLSDESSNQAEKSELLSVGKPT